MGLASGGGSSGGSSGGSGFFLGYLLGSSNGDNEVSLPAIIATGVCVLGIIGTITGAVISDNNKTKAVKNDLNTLIAEDINVKSVDTTYFDWIQEDSNYFFKFTGNASNFDGSKIDFFSAKYKVNEEQYYDVVTYVDKNHIKDLDTRKLLEKIIDIVKTSELVNSTVKGTVSTTQASRNAMAEPVVLEVSKAKVAGNVVYYDVAYMEEVKDENGNLGLVTSVARVSKAGSKELIENPNMIFATDKEDLKVIKTKENYISLEKLNILQLDGAPELQC